MFAKKNRFTVLVLIVLIAAIALSFTACGKKDETKNPPAEGSKSFKFTVVDLEGKSTDFDLTSTAATVGQALLDEGLISGDDSEYGLYVKVVNGIELNYDTDGHYWAFYVGDEYATTGVDQTELTDGASYAFKAE